MPTTLHESQLFLGGPVWGGVHRLSADVEPHAHDFLEIAVVGTGSGRHTTSQGERAVRRGDVVVLRPGAWHAFRQCSDLVVANCCVSAQGLRTELSGLQQVPILRELLWTAPVARGPHGVAVTQVDPAAADEAIEEITQLVRDLDRHDECAGDRSTEANRARDKAAEASRARDRSAEASRARDRSAEASRARDRSAEANRARDRSAEAEGVVGDGSAAMKSGRVLGRLVTVLGILADGRVERTEAGQVVHPAVAATVARLESAPADAWRLDELAEAVNLDPAYLSRLFRRHTGLSPLGYLARLRAERAATLLAHSDLPAARVGAAVGWDDPTYFARRFRSLVGSTPTQYRARTRR
jgi:AraC family L-rhamnose operon transcriptional activator RhaR